MTQQLPALTATQWDAIKARDPLSDGSFVFAVRTTGIFCRPSCPARRPSFENITTFPTPEQARRAGFRPCLRCTPMEPPRYVALVEQASRHARSMKLATATLVAKKLGVSVSTLERAFRTKTGMSFAKHTRLLRLERGRTAVTNGSTVRQAARLAGLSSASKLYGSNAAPASPRRSESIQYVIAQTPLGPLLIAATIRGLCTVQFGRDHAELVAALKTRYPHATLQTADATLAEACHEILRRIDGRPPSRDLPLDLQGTAFRLRVWNELARIPLGSTRSYSELAQRLGTPTSARAVANACASNQLAVVVPCHRVVAQSGSLAGYRWGFERKKRLLAAERQGAAGSHA